MKIIKLNHEARLKLKSGIDQVANAVKMTLGPSGRNAIIGREFQGPLITNDGITIAKEFHLEDEVEQLGVEVVKDATKSADDRAGDGTTTTTVLLQKIVAEAFKRIESGSSLVKTSGDPMKIRKEIAEACLLAVDELKKQVKPISTIDEITKVATVSVESLEIGVQIANMLNVLGADASVNVEDGVSSTTDFDIVKGTKINSGFHAPHFANEKGEYVAVKPYILVTNQHINYAHQLKDIIEKVIKANKKELIIIAEDFSKDLLTEFTITHSNGIFSVLAVKANVFHDRDKLEDYASLTGAQIIDETIKDISLEHLGTCEKIIIDKDSTLLLGCSGDVTGRIQDLKDKREKSPSKYDQDTFQKRIGILSGGVGVIRVGAQSESERNYLRLKIEDAVNATKWAMDGGVVAGGGLALKKVAETLPASILTEALKAPYNQIQENSGGLTIGEDILDPVRITITALEKACSVAGILITTDIAIAVKKDEKKSDR